MSKSLVITKSEEIEMLEAIKQSLCLLTTPETISQCIRYTYERVCGSTTESTVDIVQSYRDDIGKLRAKIKKITSDIMRSEDPEEMKALLIKLNNMNKVVNIIKNISQVDGNFNNIMFDVVSKGKLLIENEKIKMGNERNNIMRDKVQHDINISFITDGIDPTGGE